MIKTNTRFGIFAVALMLLWALVFFDSLLAMEAIWRRSDTFAHGYFILPIVLWLFWRDKTFLLNSSVQTGFWAIPFILGSLALYLFAYAADINVLSQLAAVFGLISLVWFLLGNKLAWHYKFPLAYLVFLVPMGENLIPDLQDITAWFTVAFLKLHGIPVFRDGLYIQIPTGLFEVAVACSGIRYLIASVAVGTLFAYLSYRSLKKQIIFIVFAFLLPILANGIRAYLIVIIAHYSDMEYATGADHLVYGWVFFGLVIMLMFWVGGKFADPEVTESESLQLAQNNASPMAVSLIAITSVAAVMVISMSFKSSIPVVEAPKTPKPSIKHLVSVTNSNWGINFENALMKSHVQTNEGIEVFRAVYANKQDLGELITNQNSLYDQDKWTVIDRTASTFEGHKAKFLLLRDITGNERVVVYWYQVGEQALIGNSLVKLNQALQLFINPNSVSEVIAYSLNTNLGAEGFELIEKQSKSISTHFTALEKELKQ